MAEDTNLPVPAAPAAPQTDEEKLAAYVADQEAQDAARAEQEAADRLEAMRIDPPIPIPADYPALLETLFPGARPGFEYARSDDGTMLIGWNLHQFKPPMSADDIVAEQAKAAQAHVRAKRQPLLDESDLIATRCFKAGIPFPESWRTYTQALRDWTKKPTDPQPVTPPMPEGI